MMMSSSWTERQGHVGDLTHLSRGELRELLLRQEKILSSRRLVQTLPDKGKKVKEFAVEVRLAIERLNEEEKRQSLGSTATTEFQSKYQQAFSMQQRGISKTPADSNQPMQIDVTAGDMTQDGEPTPASADTQEDDTLDGQQDQSASGRAAAEASLNSVQTKENSLVEAFERVRLSEYDRGLSSKSKDPLQGTSRNNNVFEKHILTKPHYITVLEKTEKTSGSRKQKFKTNQLAQESDVSPSGSSAPSQSSEGSSLLSLQTRRERDRKHLDDVTAARLPLLHHSPTQLLSLDESAVLIREQTKKQQELQAKLAAQKLSEGLELSMGSYTPDGGPMAAYREVHDDGAQLSSEED